MQVAQDRISIVAAADDNYSMPLAALGRSAIDTLDSRFGLDIYVLDGGITDRQKRRIQASWKSPRTSVYWLSPDRATIQDLPTCGYLSLTTYLRLFIGELLPPSVHKAIYLDSDMIVRRDLSQLWSTPCDDVACCAVQDLLTPFINTRQTLGRETVCDRQPLFTLPIPNYRDLGLSPDASYFNAGLLLINVDYWRRTSFLTAALRCLRDNGAKVHLGDQYALNILFSGKWRPLDLRWNQLGTIYECAHAGEFPFEPSLFQTVRDDPWAVHYCWTAKPWSAGCAHPWRQEFFRFLDHTRWKHWRPHRPYSTSRDWCELKSGEFRHWFWTVFFPQVLARRHQFRLFRRKIKNMLLGRPAEWRKPTS